LGGCDDGEAVAGVRDSLDQRGDQWTDRESAGEATDQLGQAIAVRGVWWFAGE
jgi:hypothetical protein